MIQEPKRSPPGNEKEEVSYQVQTKSWRDQKLVVERVVGPWVAFRVKGTRLYLTQHLYDDEARNSLIHVLLTEECNSVSAILLPELIPPIVEYAVDQGSDSTNFEGAGFCYQPMTVEPPCTMTKKPSLLQQFTLVEPTPEDSNSNIFRRDGDYFREANGRYLLRERRWGIRSRFGKYWRSQHWDNTVSQSSHLLGDEEWTLSEVDDNTSPT